MRKLKGPWAALAAILAIGVFVVPVALADEFTAEEQPLVLTANESAGSSSTFIVDWGAFLCKSSIYSDVTASFPGTSIAVTPSYSDCTMFGLPSPVDMNGCTYQLNLEGGTKTTGNIDLICPAGSEVTYTMTPVKCIVHVKAQKMGGTIAYSNIGAGTTREIQVEAELKNISYTQTKGTGLGGCETTSKFNGSMFLKMTFTAENSGGSKHIGIFMSSI